MKQIILVRHAKSSWDYPELDDFDRPLNSRGLKDGPRMAKWLKRKINVVDQLISSPAKRAKSTAEYFAREFLESTDLINFENKLYHAGAESILKLVQELDSGLGKVILFGHNPGFTYFADEFSDAPIHNIPTCGIVNIDFDVTDWKMANSKNGRVVFFMYPKMLE